MARLGEHLIAAGLVPADKVEQALRAQVVWGGRLGTNLIELGCVDLDGLSRVLGQQQNIPAALARHFDKADPALQAQLPPDLARRFSVVPLVRLGADRIAVVALDPLGPSALAALADVYGVSADTGIVSSVAAEMRVLYHLERVYKIARPTRYLRSKNTSITPFPQFDNVPVEVDEGSDLAIPITVDETAHPTGRAEPPAPLPRADSVDEMVVLIDEALDKSAAHRVPVIEPAGRDRRTYVRTLGDDPPAATPPATPPPPSPALKAETALGRIAIRKVAVSATAPTMTVSTTAVPAGPPASLPEATRAIRRGLNREIVAQLVMDAVEDFIPRCHAALLLMVRGDVAIGWKHFSRVKETAPEVAVPLDKPGLVPSAIERKATTRCFADDLGAIDTLLLHGINDLVGDLVIVPVMVADQVMCLLAASTEMGEDVTPIETVASAASTAFARLIRDASR